MRPTQRFWALILRQALVSFRNNLPIGSFGKDTIYSVVSKQSLLNAGLSVSDQRNLHGDWEAIKDPRRSCAHTTQKSTLPGA